MTIIDYLVYILLAPLLQCIMSEPFARTAVVASIAIVLAALPAFFSEPYANVAVILSNFAYVVPILISYYCKNFDFLLSVVISTVVSILYHSCKSFDVCFRLDEASWESIDVSYSWFLLLTFASFFAFKDRFLHAAPLHVIIITWGSHAHCSNTYDCRAYKAVVVCIYLAFVFVQGVRNPSRYDVLDILLSLACFVGAALVYLFFNTTAGHTMWHIVGAIGLAFLLTSYSDAPFHTLGLRSNRLLYQTVVPQRADI